MQQHLSEWRLSPQVTMEESGEGSGGYAKEMSQAFLDAEVRITLLLMLMAFCPW